VRDLCDEYEALLIFDEIQCGIGRTGSFFAYQNFNVIPDVIAMAKGLGGGFPIGAVMANERANVLQPGDHGSTFGGNPLACAVSLAVMNELLEGGIIAGIEEKSSYFKAKLGKLKSKYSFITEVKGMGFLIGIAMDIDVKAFSGKCFEHKLLVATAGKDVIRILPPLNITISEIDEVVQLLDEVMEEISKEVSEETKSGI